MVANVAATSAKTSACTDSPEALAGESGGTRAHASRRRRGRAITRESGAASTRRTRTMSENSPQAKEMAHESMVRNLAAQIEAIWPQEEPIFARNAPRAAASILDVGCGTGELAPRLLERFPGASYLGVDLEEPHLERARARCAAFGARARFERGDALELPCRDGQFEL